MNIISKPTIIYYVNEFPVAATSLLAWYKDFLKRDFDNFNKLKAVYKNASVAGNNRVIFNIKGNDFRLIAGLDFKRKAAYIIWFGTHSQYDKINVATVPYISV